MTTLVSEKNNSFIFEKDNLTIINDDGLNILDSLKDGSVDLILTDPPYVISKDSGMNTFEKKVQKIDESGVNVKTEAEWLEYKEKKGYVNDEWKKNYLKYGNTSGKKYGYKTDYGEWDKDFTIDKLDQFIKLFYKKLRKGGTLIIWFDLWKKGELRTLMEKAKTDKTGFKQIRFIEWIKTNPVPLNQHTNYLSNCREIALLGVKGSKPTFNSKRDNGIYFYPIQHVKKGLRHPTQKNFKLFEELIRKHSNEGDLVVDTFLGGGTTVIACKNTGRRFFGGDINKKYFDIVTSQL